MTPVQHFAIGTSYAGLVNVESLTTQAANMSPRVEYRAYREAVVTGDNGRKAIGAPIIVWNFGYIYSDALSSLRTLCPGAASSVVIRTRTEDANPASSGQYVCYEATMIWPELDSYQYRAGTYQPFQLLFQNPVVYTP
jgi:hypothetical protein